MSSLPSRERGLKFAFRQGQINSVIRSLPSRERGLKSYKAFECRATMSGSLPSRERGLKYEFLKIDFCATVSLPSRERGLKYLIAAQSCNAFCRSLRGSVD